ncbi:hypothetical protein J4H86_00475 [Spiractinospora alimapuensis]|nr:hypothetical protein [Spiractinospora alimapuensis]QVQ52382.1 hypothetical protein J4H86_00475 [Spiractinospora alimapuensis]
MEIPTALLVVMFGAPVVAIVVIVLLARNWTTPVEEPEDDTDPGDK